ncbi:MAG: serine/threonine protein kinase [Planctomycetia bacterium]
MLEHSAAWDAVVAYLEPFVQRWGDGRPPRLAEHLPAGPPAIRQRVLVELVKADIDERLRAGCPLPIAQYRREHPELGEQRSLLLEIIHEDFQLRRQRGEAIDVEAYCTEHPELTSEIRRWCQPLGLATTTSLSRAAAIRLPELAPGETIDDFLLVAALGRGAFATVWLARQVSMGRMVALKVSADRGEEAVTLAQLDHPHIVRVYDQRRLPERGLRLLYEQFLPGGTLAAVVHRVHRTPVAERSAAMLLDCVREAAAAAGLDLRGAAGRGWRNWPDTVAAIGIDLARALDHAHAAGVLHRDVKPANVILGADAAPHLADFNTSWLAAHPAAGAAASFGGSMAYMSPEHLEAFDPSHPRPPEDLDARADLYSLAVLLWELLAGRRPFRDESPADAELGAVIAGMIARRRRAEIDVSTVGDDAARGPLVGVLRECLAADRDERPASGAAMARRLAVCLEPRAAGLLAPARRGWRGLARRHPFFAVAACVLLPNLVLVVFNFLYNRRLLLEIYSTPERLPLQPAFTAAFERTTVVVNAIAFPLGILFAWLFTRPIVRGMAAPGAATMPADAGVDRGRARRATLRLGDAAAWIGVIEWLAAALVFPLGIWLQVGSLAPEVPWLFMQSPVACGLLAAAYPFFLATLLVVRVFYPAQLAAGGAGLDRADDEPALRALATRSGFYLLVAAGVPLLTLGLLLVLHGSTDRLALALLSVAGLLGLAFASWARQSIQSDTEAIIAVGRPLDRIGTESRSTARP